MSNAVKGLTTGALIIGVPPVQLTGMAFNGGLTKSMPGFGRASERFRSLHIQTGAALVSGGEEFTQGIPTSPSLRFDAAGAWKFRWVVSAGTQTLTISCMQAANQAPRPSVVVKAHPAIGVNSDITVSAPSGGGWVAISVPVTAAATGAVWVELHSDLDASPGVYPTFFDHLSSDNGLVSEFDVWLDGAPVIFQASTLNNSSGGTPNFMAHKLQLIVRPIAPNPPDKNNPKAVQDAVSSLQEWTRSAEKAFRQIEAAFNKAVSGS